MLALLLSCGMIYYHLGIYLPHAIQRRVEIGLGGGYSFGDDFYPIWLTSRAALQQHSNPYTAESTHLIQLGIFGRSLDPPRAGDPPPDYRAFAYPAYIDLIFWPLAMLPFPTVRVGLAIALTIATTASIPLWLRFLGFRASPALLTILLMLTLSNSGVLEGLFAAQLGLFVGFLLAAAFAALTEERLFFAGSLFSITFMKPQMSAIAAIYLILWSVSDWRERRAFVFGLFSWSVLLLTASLIVWPHWITQWLHILSSYGSYSEPPLIIYSLGPNLGQRLGPFLIASLLAAAAILMWKMRNVPASSPLFSLTVSLLLALTAITIIPGQAVHDQVVLLPGILFIAWTWRSSSSPSLALKVIIAASALALFWQWGVATVLIVLQHFISPERFFTNRVIMLPYSAAASVPLAVSATLAYLMAKALRKKRIAYG